MLLISFSAFTQINDKIKLFLDCNAYCDIDYIKTEISLVDFTRDNKDADVHLLITQQNTGGGGDQYQLIFFGQNKYRNLRDTLRFNTERNNTEYEIRDQLLKYIQLGLAPFIARTGNAKYAVISLKHSGISDQSPISPTKDKWNYWVFSIGTNGNFSGEKSYKGVRYNGNFSASRITDDIKISFRLNGGKNKTTYLIEDPSGNIEIITNNHNYSFNHRMVKSINQHWSYGYDAILSNSTFSNYKLQTIFNPAVEYNIFPYKESNNKLLTMRYGVDIRHNRYYDTTLYRKTKETLLGQGANVSLSFTQKWGGSSVGISYHNYLNNFKYYNLGMNGNINIRITGGLSFNAFMFAGLVRDQIYLSGEGVTERDVLTRKRQLASNYNYYTSFGLNYRFGSKINNFVNPRFEGGSGSFFFF